jgi:pyruvate, water dikinase
MSNIILWFDDITKDDVPSAGGKGANLGELTRNGVPVPPGFVVSAGAYRDFLERASIRDAIARALASADASNVQGLQVVSDEVRSLIENAEVPGDVAADVWAAYEKMGGGPVAVRSSATAEDLPSASFAGQQSTYLNVEGPDAVIEALRACWASLFEPHAISYRALNGFDHMETAIAVPVQRMVQSERSGVIFTINPVTGEQGQVVIEAVWGLGEAAVSGQVTPDMYVVDKAGHAVVERAHSPQEHELLRDPDGHTLHANAWRDVPTERRDAPKLSDRDAVALAKLAIRVEILYGRPQDIEWAIEGGETYILQARPVTTV